MIKPIFTEKSLKLAKEGKYSFWVGRGMGKKVAKSEIGKTFGVHVVSIKMLAGKSEAGRNMRGVNFVKEKSKKAIVSLKGDEKIDIFEESKAK